MKTQIDQTLETLAEGALPSRPPYKFEWYTEQDGTANGVIRRHDGVIVAEQVLESNGKFIAAALNALPAFLEARRLVNEQAEDEALWCEAGSIVEAYVQQELRMLHAAVEGQKLERGDSQRSAERSES